MGLLDALRNGDDPGGGLLAFLQSIQPGQGPQPGPLPSDQAQYGVAPVNAPPLGQTPVFAPAAPQQNSPQFAPSPAPPPVISAQPTQLPPAAAGPSGIGGSVLSGAQGAGGHLMAGLQSFANSGGPLPALANGITGLISGQRTDPTGVAAQQQALDKNLTAKALRAKGVPEDDIQAAVGGNTVLLKQLIDEKYGHGDRDFAFRQQEARRAQLNADRTFGLAARSADRADEGPVEKAAYRAKVAQAYGLDPNSSEGRAFIISGQLPDDPAYLGRVAKAKAEAEASLPGGGGLSLNPVYGKDIDGNTVLLQPGKNGVAVQSKLPEGVTLNGVDDAALRADAERLNAGDPNVLKKYSNKGQGRVDLLRLNNEANRQREAKGQAPIDITQNTIAYQGDTARERAAGTMEGRMAPASIEAQGAFKIAQNAADNLWRTNNVPLNKVIQMGQAATSNPELKAAAVAFNTAVMTYSRAIAPTGVGTVDSQQHAREILDKADGPKATEAAFAQLAREVDMAHASPGIARQYFAAARKARLEGKAAPEMPTYQPAHPAASAPPPEAIAALKQDPRRAADFDAYYGAGSASALLGGPH
ncbi:MAG: hypothetical protein JWP25_3623 [Bradyrhizobium sp.]|nr:hypothetical protein [Bradyrhizobium sp.]